MVLHGRTQHVKQCKHLIIAFSKLLLTSTVPVQECLQRDDTSQQCPPDWNQLTPTLLSSSHGIARRRRVYFSSLEASFRIDTVRPDIATSGIHGVQRQVQRYRVATVKTSR